jgi:hypothetical protein
VLLTETLESIIVHAKLPGPTEQADNFVRWLGRNIPYPGRAVQAPLELAMAVMGAADVDGYVYVMEYLFAEKLVDWRTRNPLGQQPGPFSGTLTFRGWARYDTLQRTSPKSRTVFMAMKYGDGLLEKVYKDCFKPAVANAGLDLRRLDEAPEPGIIDNRLRVAIRDSVMLIADLTHNNAGAYWEAGFAEGLGRPVLYTCQEEFFKKLGAFADTGGTHFDTNHCLTVLWQEASLDIAASALTATVRVGLPHMARHAEE